MAVIRESEIHVNEQMELLQFLMQRIMLRSCADEEKIHNPYKGQGRILAILRKKPEISQKELLHLLNTSKQAISGLLSRLEKSSYIVREPSQGDKRAIIIKLTAEGMNAACSMGEADADPEGIFDCLDEGELEDFSALLDRVIKRCESHFPDEDFEERRRIKQEFKMSDKSALRPCEIRPDLFKGRCRQTCDYVNGGCKK